MTPYESGGPAPPQRWPSPELSRRKCYIRKLAQFGDELVLELRIAGLSGRLLLAQVVPVATADHCGRLIAHCQPGLGTLSGVEVHRRSWAAHLRAYPAGIDRVAQDLRPVPRHSKCQRDHLKLALGIGLCRIPGALRPIDIPQRTLPAPMQAAAEVNQPSGTMDQRRQDVGRQRVHREYAGVTFRARAAALLRVYACVVDDRIHPADSVDLVRDAPGL